MKQLWKLLKLRAPAAIRANITTETTTMTTTATITTTTHEVTTSNNAINSAFDDIDVAVYGDPGPETAALVPYEPPSRSSGAVSSEITMYDERAHLKRPIDSTFLLEHYPEVWNHEPDNVDLLEGSIVLWTPIDDESEYAPKNKWGRKDDDDNDNE